MRIIIICIATLIILIACLFLVIFHIFKHFKNLDNRAINNHLTQITDTQFYRKDDLKRRIEEEKYISRTFQDFLPTDNLNFEISEDEIRFLKNFFIEMAKLRKKLYIRSERRGDGTIHVEWKGRQVGRINFQKNPYYAQQLKGLKEVKHFYGTFDEVLPVSYKWARYIVNHLTGS